MRIFIIASSLLALFPAVVGVFAEDPKQPKRTSLVKVSEFASEHREAAKAVAASLVEAKEMPKEFYAEVEPKENGQILVFHLWHSSAFEPQNKDVVGNPGGKCRDVIYDVKQRKVIKTLFWQ